MSLLLGLASLTTTGMVVVSGGTSVQAHQQIHEVQTQPKHHKVTKVTVQPGDNLSVIAGKYKTSWRRVYDANKTIKNPDVINPGDKLRIPDKKEKIKHRPLPGAQSLSSAAANAPAPQPATVSHTVPVQHYTTVVNAGIWDQLAACESGGNWSINTGNGFYGGLQFTLATWLSVGGTGYPNQASREEQIARAQILQARSGWGNWPACASKLGLL